MESSFTGNSMLFITDIEGNKMTLEHDDITSMIFKVLKLAGTNDRLLALNLADKVMCRLNLWSNSGNQLSVSDVEQMVRFVLTECGQSEACKQNLLVLKQVSQLS
jgi:hypothetical protein